MKRIFGLIFLAIFVSCAPTSVGNESWSRVVFVASESAAQKGCTAAITQPPGSYIGQKPFASVNGAVNFMSTPGKVGIFCQLFSFGLQTATARDQYFSSGAFKQQIRDAHAYVVVFTKETDFKKVSLYLSLEDKDGKEFAQLRNASVEGVLPGVRYDFDQLNPSDLANIDKTVSFSIVVNRGFGEEKFRVTPSNLDPFNINP